MYSWWQGLCAANKTQQQPNVIISARGKNKKTCAQRETSAKVCELLHRTDYGGLKGPVCRVCSGYASVSHIKSPKGMTFLDERRLRAEGALFLYFILLWLLFLALHLGGKSLLGWLRNEVLTVWCFRCGFDWQGAYKRLAFSSRRGRWSYLLLICMWDYVPARKRWYCPHGSQVADTCVLLMECQCLVIDCFDMCGPLQQAKGAAVLFEMLIGEHKHNSIRCVLAMTLCY